MPETYLVVEANRREWQGKDTLMVSYYMKLEQDDKEVEDVKLFGPAADTHVYKGDHLQADLKWDSKKGWQVEKGWSTTQQGPPNRLDPSAALPAGASTTASPAHGAPAESADFPAESEGQRQQRIIRQHSQEMAIRTLDVMGSTPPEAADTLTAGERVDAWKRVVSAWTDYYMEDAINPGATPPANEGQAHPSASAPPAPENGSIPPDQALKLWERLEKTLDSDSARRMALLASGVKDTSDVQSAVAGLTPAQAVVLEEVLSNAIPF